MKYFKDILELILECLLFYEKIKIQGITCKKNMDLNRVLKKMSNSTYFYCACM